MKYWLAFVLGLTSCFALFVAQFSHAAITVRSGISAEEGIHAQVAIDENTAIDGNGRGIAPAISIIRMSCSILVRDSLEISNGLQLKKSQLSPLEAWGQGTELTRGPANTDVAPYFGLSWPYRDRYDFSQFAQEFDPIGDDVGVPFDSQPGVYGFVNVNGHSRGGPQDPDAGSQLGYLHRGVTGMGEDLDHPASYFKFDIIPLEGPSDREVTLKIFAASAVVVTTFDGGQTFGTQNIQIPDFETTIRLPEPTSLAVLGLGGLLLRRRSRTAEPVRHG